MPTCTKQTKARNEAIEFIVSLHVAPNNTIFILTEKKKKRVLFNQKYYIKNKLRN